MTQYIDFVALGWIEKYLREEMDSALKCLKSFEREPQETQHLRDALRNVHSASGVLRLCALDPAALLTEELERVMGQLIQGVISGEARKLAMTELVAGIAALPAYLANVRAKREISAGVLANIINDLRHFGNRPTLPDSLFFNPSIKLGAGISLDKQPAEEANLKQFAARALRICYEYSKPALKRDHEALKRLYAVGKHSAPLLAGTQMEPYFRCFMGMIEALAQPNASADEVMVDVLKHTFVFFKSMARNGMAAIEEANPTPYIKKMLYYIAKSPSPTALQQSLRDTFDVQDVDDVRIESSGRLIQEDDLLEALSHTMSQLLEVMEFITLEHGDICASNSQLVVTIVPRLRQVSLQLKAIGLITHAETIAEQHGVLEQLAQREKPARQSELLDFGGALVAVKESLEHKLKHGLSAQGDTMSHDLDAAIVQQTVRCLADMKGSINRELARKDLLQFIEETQTTEVVSSALLRPFYRAGSLINDPELQDSMTEWDHGEFPAQEKLLALAEQLLSQIPEHSYAEQAATDMEQVLSVLGLMEDKNTESAVLADCSRYIRESVEQGGLVNDAGMACFAEAIAALEQYMERCTEDPLGNSDEHLDRAQARAKMLDSFILQRRNEGRGDENILDFDSANNEPVILGDLDLGDRPAVDAAPAPSVGTSADAPAATEVETNVVALATKTADKDTTNAQSTAAGIPWQDALKWWQSARIERGPEAPPEDADVELDEELMDCFVEEGRKYIRKLEDAAPRFAADLGNEQAIMEIRAIFHTMKGSARTIELYVFGEFMFDMEKVFNSLRDGYIQGTPEIAQLVRAVCSRLPSFIEMMQKRVHMYTGDFQVPHAIAAAMASKEFDAGSMTISVPEIAASEPAAVQESPVQESPVQESPVQESPDAEIPHAADAESPVSESAVPPGAEQTEEVQAQLRSEPVASIPEAAQRTDVAVEELLEMELIEEGEQNTDASDDRQNTVTNQSADVWVQDNADVILAHVCRLLHDNHSPTEVPEYSARALILMRALVPAMVELREGGFLELDESTMAYFLDLPVIQHLASNAVFGLVDNGKGEFFKYPLSAEVIDGLQRYLDTLNEAELEGNPDRINSLHDDVRSFVRSSLSLPSVEAFSGTGTDGISEASMQQFEVSAPVVGLNNDWGKSQDSAPTSDDDPYGGTPRPKGEAGQEPEAILEPAPAAEEAAEDASEEAVDEPVEDIDLELLDLFIETLDEYLEGIDSAVESLQEGDVSAVQTLKNNLHTVKGSANSVGVRRFGKLVHDFESRIIELEHKGDVATPAALEHIYPLADELHDAAHYIRGRRADWNPDAEIVTPDNAEDTDSDVQIVGVDEDIDLELLDLFIETLDEYLESIDSAVALLAEGDMSGVQQLKNTLHTIKGGANSVGVRRFGTLVHDFESRIVDLEHEGSVSSAEGLGQIYPRVDEMHEAARFISRIRGDWDSEAAAALGEEKAEETSQLAETVATARKDVAAEKDTDEDAAPKRVESLRVSTGKIDRLLDTGLEISMSTVRTRRALDAALQDGQEVQGLARRVQALVDQLSLQLDTEIQAKTESASQGEHFDPLEMDRITEKQGLAAILREAAYDLHEESRELGEHIDTAMRESVSSGRLADSSQSEMRLLRLVSFSKLGPGFRRLVHQVARQLNKQVEFEITCGDGGLDVGVFEQLKTALEHMLRNSIDHGIDTPEERAKRGKTGTGRVSLIIYREASEFVVRLLDDGNGLDPDRLRNKAKEQGLIAEGEHMSDEDALRLIFHAGLSTAKKVTDVSGRGVGMDVVLQSIAQVGGTIDVQSKLGFYTQFDIRIPASIMVNGALLARVGDEDVAIPLTSLDGSDFLSREEIHKQAAAGKKGRVNFRGESYELRYLGSVRGTLDIPKIDDMAEFVPVLFARLEGRRVGFFVDSVANAEELVIRSLGAQFTGVPGVAGGSLKSDGQPVLALDLNQFIRQVDYADQARQVWVADEETSTLILCVDDSVMMRRTYEKRLQSIGYEVVTAVDGEDALDYLSGALRKPHFIFTDLEMPNMNGFDFIANLRRVPELANVPAVVVSSRDGEKHRAEANKVGATDFMAKGSNSAEAMGNMIERYLDPKALAS